MSKGIDFITHPPIGLSVLFLDSPQFPWSRAATILEGADRPILATLLDWKGKHVHNLQKVAGHFKKLDRTPPELNLYVLCGPCRKPRRDGSLEAFHPELSIGELNRQWFKRPRLQSDFSRLAYNHLKHIEGLGWPTINLIPELEDSLRPGVYNSMVSLLGAVMGNWPLQTHRVVRNRLGNPPYNGAKEVHGLASNSLHLVTYGDFTSGDGDVFRWNGERIGSKEYSWGYLKAFVRQAQNQGVGVLLWHPEWQDPGRKPINRRVFKFTHPKDLKQILKEGNYALN